MPRPRLDVSRLRAADVAALAVLGVRIRRLRAALSALGICAARSLGIDRLEGTPRIWIGGRWFVVVGILNPMPLAPEIDQSVMVGWQEAASEMGFNGFPTRIYVRAATDQVVAVDTLLAATANPQSPEQVAASRPSDALAARVAVV